MFKVDNMCNFLPQDKVVGIFTKMDSILKPSWNHLETILKSSWNHLEIILKSSWNNLEIKSSWNNLEILIWIIKVVEFTKMDSIKRLQETQKAAGRDPDPDPNPNPNP